MNESTEWKDVWEREDISRWDYLSQVILGEIKLIVGNLKNKKMIELGSGSGRISEAMSRMGAEVTLLDMIEDILKRSKKQFLNDKGKGDFVAGAFPNLPIKDSQFDIVWNAGVLEHFSEEDRKGALLEMGRVCKNEGLAITMNPCKRSLLHNLGARFMARHPSYPYKDEKPIKTLEEVISELGFSIVKKEYSMGFFVLFTGMFKRLSLFPRLQNVGMKVFYFTSDIMCILDKSFLGGFIRYLDKIFSRVFGGYLLVSVFSPKK